MARAGNKEMADAMMKNARRESFSSNASEEPGDNNSSSDKSSPRTSIYKQKDQPGSGVDGSKHSNFRRE